LLLRMFAIGPVIVCLHIPASQLLMAFNNKKTYLRVLSQGTVVNIACNLLLVNVWGAVGTAVSLLLTELFITVAFNRELYRHRLTAFVIKNEK